MTTNKFYENPSIQVDTHTHTVLSGHAFSTLLENINQAATIGLKGLCSTDHAYSMEDTTVFFIPSIFDLVDDEVNGVKVYMGLEFNILDRFGNVDKFNEICLSKVGFGIGSLHNFAFQDDFMDDYTSCYIGALANPVIDIIGHPGNPDGKCDIARVVAEAKKHNKMIEINNHSFHSRAGSKVNCIKFAQECIKKDVRICVSSDAHFCKKVGFVPEALALLAEINFPPELILNRTVEGFNEYIEKERKPRMLNL